MDQVEIRHARLSDVPAMTQLVTELGYPATPEDMRARLEKLLPDPRQFIALAVRGEEIIGLIAAEHRLVLETGESIEIMGLVVAAQARRQGIGGILLSAAETWAREKGVTALRVRSNVARTQSHPFYLGHGYARHKMQHVYAKRIDA